MTWFVAHTLARSEAIAEHHLRQAGYGTLYLHGAKTIRHGRQSFVVLRPYFPRYVFLETQPGQGLYGAAKAVGVASLVACAGVPLEVPERVMNELRRRCDRGGFIAEEVEMAHLFRPGTEVRILNGPFENFLATVAVDNGREIRLWLQVFGRSTETTLASTSVETASPECAAR